MGTKTLLLAISVSAASFATIGRASDDWDVDSFGRVEISTVDASCAERADLFTNRLNKLLNNPVKLSCNPKTSDNEQETAEIYLESGYDLPSGTTIRQRAIGIDSAHISYEWMLQKVKVNGQDQYQWVLIKVLKGGIGAYSGLSTCHDDVIYQSKQLQEKGLRVFDAECILGNDLRKAYMLVYYLGKPG